MPQLVADTNLESLNTLTPYLIIIQELQLS